MREKKNHRTKFNEINILQNLRVEASIDRMSKQIHVQQDESNLWKNRLKNHQQELFDLHKKIRTSVSIHSIV